MKIKVGKIAFPSMEKLKDFLKRYKFVVITILAGIVLLALPEGTGDSGVTTTTGVVGGEEDFSVEALEEKLGDILSKIDGAGEVKVMLTVRTGMERILATNVEEDGDEYQEEVVVISAEDGEEVVLLCQNYPVFQGALVVCRGGDDPEVQLKITRALASLTGLSTARITVCKGS